MSDGAQGLLSPLRHALPLVHLWRYIFHTWGKLPRQTAQAAQEWQEEEALAELQAYPKGAGLWLVLNGRVIELLTHRLAGHEGVRRISPEWLWRDFRLREPGAQHRSAERPQLAGTVYTFYRNFRPS